jgi:hypothetical protein
VSEEEKCDILLRCLTLDIGHYLMRKYHMKKFSIKFSKHFHTGMSILHKNSDVRLLLSHYGDRERCYQGNKSYIYQIKTEDFYEDLKTILDYFPNSD